LLNLSLNAAKINFIS